jgi:hypothetical protein
MLFSDLGGLSGNTNERDQIEEVIARSVSREELAFRSFLRIYEMSNPHPTIGCGT